MDGLEAGDTPSEPSKLEIREAYRDYKPPVDVSAIVQRLLLTVPAKYLRGLNCILLTNEAALPRRDRVGKVWSRKRKFDKSRVLGRYHGRSRSSQPYIELRVDKIVRGLPGFPLRIRFLREIVFGHVLFHEIGHHIHHTIRPEHTEKEDLANKWAGKLNANFIRKNYWYALPMLKAYIFMRRKRWI
ncbi:MAG: hypothetical protein H0X25_08200 [Acidobacteriales bacterium]|nr:hypothetical protein [Terriglobales bacterium]